MGENLKISLLCDNISIIKNINDTNKAFKVLFYREKITMQKILIIEDDKLLAQELKELLENAGYQPIILESFQEITKNILKQNADLILLDINLPDNNGQLLLKEIRKKSNIPVIMVTSRDTETDEVHRKRFIRCLYIEPDFPNAITPKFYNILTTIEDLHLVTTINIQPNETTKIVKKLSKLQSGLETERYNKVKQYAKHPVFLVQQLGRQLNRFQYRMNHPQ